MCDTYRFKGLSKREQAIVLINELFDTYDEAGISVDECLEYAPIDNEGQARATIHRIVVSYVY